MKSTKSLISTIHTQHVSSWLKIWKSLTQVRIDWLTDWLFLCLGVNEHEWAEPPRTLANSKLVFFFFFLLSLRIPRASSKIKVLAACLFVIYSPISAVKTWKRILSHWRGILVNTRSPCLIPFPFWEKPQNAKSERIDGYLDGSLLNYNYPIFLRGRKVTSCVVLYYYGRKEPPS